MLQNTVNEYKKAAVYTTAWVRVGLDG
jgi:hypothetical protein